MASEGGHEDTVNYLVVKGADISIRNQKQVHFIIMYDSTTDDD